MRSQSIPWRRTFLLLMVLVLGACGATEAPPATTGTQGAAATPTTARPKMRVALVTDLGKVTDGTYNQAAYEGMKRAEAEFGLETAFIETVNQSDYEKNLEKFAAEKYDLIIAGGFFMGDAVKAVATRYPDLKFAIVDVGTVDMPNVRGMTFAEDEAGFLAGAVAGLLTTNGKVGVVGGMEIPPVQRYVKGYANGAAAVNPAVQVSQVYIPSFTDPAVGAEAATNQLAEGVDVIFGAGGQTGSGAIQQAAQSGAWVIGVDNDEYRTTFKGGPAPKLATSALKRVDIGVYEVIKDVVKGTFKPGVFVGTAANGGVDLAPFHDAAIPDTAKAKIDEIRKGLADGSIKTNVIIP